MIGSDDDGDPLTWSVGAQPTTPGSSVALADAARGDFTFMAANAVGTDTFEAIATDGVTGHQARAMINVNVVNDPPEITLPAARRAREHAARDPGRLLRHRSEQRSAHRHASTPPSAAPSSAPRASGASSRRQDSTARARSCCTRHRRRPDDRGPRASSTIAKRSARSRSTSRTRARPRTIARGIGAPLRSATPSTRRAGRRRSPGTSATARRRRGAPRSRTASARRARSW